MSDSVPAALTARLRRLEILTAGLALVVAALAFQLLRRSAASDVPLQLRAQGFELVSASGVPLARLAAPSGLPSLVLMDSSGVQRVRLLHDAEGSGLYVQDEVGTTRLGAVHFAHGGGGFALHGPDAKGAAVLYLKGDGSLRMFDSTGVVTAQFPARRP